MVPTFAFSTKREVDAAYRSIRGMSVDQLRYISERTSPSPPSNPVGWKVAIGTGTGRRTLRNGVVVSRDHKNLVIDFGAAAVGPATQTIARDDDSLHFLGKIDLAEFLRKKKALQAVSRMQQQGGWAASVIQDILREGRDPTAVLAAVIQQDEESSDEYESSSESDSDGDIDDDDSTEDDDSSSGSSVESDTEGSSDDSAPSAKSTAPKVPVKWVFGQNIRRQLLPLDQSFKRLMRELKQSFGRKGRKLVLMYKDDEGDMVHITDQDDLQFALDHHHQRLELAQQHGQLTVNPGSMASSRSQMSLMDPESVRYSVGDDASMSGGVGHDDSTDPDSPSHLPSYQLQRMVAASQPGSPPIRRSVSGSVTSSPPNVPRHSPSAGGSMPSSVPRQSPPRHASASQRGQGSPSAREPRQLRSPERSPSVGLRNAHQESPNVRLDDSYDDDEAVYRGSAQGGVAHGVGEGRRRTGVGLQASQSVQALRPANGKKHSPLRQSNPAGGIGSSMASRPPPNPGVFSVAAAPLAQRQIKLPLKRTPVVRRKPKVAIPDPAASTPPSAPLSVLPALRIYIRSEASPSNAGTGSAMDRTARTFFTENQPENGALPSSGAGSTMVGSSSSIGPFTPMACSSTLSRTQSDGGVYAGSTLQSVQLASALNTGAFTSQLLPSPSEGALHSMAEHEPTVPSATQTGRSQSVPPASSSVVTDSLQDGIIHGDEAIQNIGTIEHWKRGPLLGRGSFGKVYEALDLATGRVMAVKQVKTVTDRRSDQQQAHGHARQTQAEQAMKLGLVALDEAGDGVNAAEKKPVVELTPDAKEVEALETEIALLRTLNHPNIIAYLGTQRTPTKLYIFLEYAAGGSLAAAVARFGAFSEAVVRRFTRDVLRGLDYLHKKGIIHRDIKGSNLLISNGKVKLADFGCSKQLSSNAPSVLQHTAIGTTQFMAPEIMTGNGAYGAKADIWSLGMAVIEMATGKPPWSNPAHAVYKICMTDDLPPLPDTLSEEAHDFLALCFRRESSERPSAETLLQHPFLRDASTAMPNMFKPTTHLKRAGSRADGSTTQKVATMPQQQQQPASIVGQQQQRSPIRLSGPGRRVSVPLATLDSARSGASTPGALNMMMRADDDRPRTEGAGTGEGYGDADFAMAGLFSPSRSGDGMNSSCAFELNESVESLLSPSGSTAARAGGQNRGIWDGGSDTDDDKIEGVALADALATQNGTGTGTAATKDVGGLQVDTSALPSAMKARLQLHESALNGDNVSESMDSPRSPASSVASGQFETLSSPPTPTWQRDELQQMKDAALKQHQEAAEVAENEDSDYAEEPGDEAELEIATEPFQRPPPQQLRDQFMSDIYN